MIQLLHDSIREHAELSPEKTAFRCRDRSICYRDLFRRSNQLANFLISKGLPLSGRVGIFLSKSIETPISTYGVLTSGGAYVPIDPSSSIERIAFMLKDCGIEFLITDTARAKLVNRIPLGKTPLKLVIGIEQSSLSHFPSIGWQELGDYPCTLPPPRVCEQDLAYIMYTSGSTGQPKGLMHTHTSGLTYARRSAELYSVRSDDVLGNHAPLHFDISTFEFLTGPLVGATSVLIPEEVTMFAESLAELIEREKLTLWYSVPLALIQLLTRSDLRSRNLSALRWIIFAGEPLPAKYARQMQEIIPGASFCNVYGPAEVNQCSYYHLPTLDKKDDEVAIPIGSIWDGARALVVNQDGTPTQQGQIGQLLIASSTMMQGYWNRQDLNEKAFFFEESMPGFIRKYYRTGDLVHVDSKGVYHFHGRMDRQIKLRGYRIELDEVEAAFTVQPSVEESAAFTRENADYTKTLCVAITLNQAAENTESKLLKVARQRLPHYAIPEQVFILDSFPRTGSGKTDRTQLGIQLSNTAQV